MSRDEVWEDELETGGGMKEVGNVLLLAKQPNYFWEGESLKR